MGIKVKEDERIYGIIRGLLKLPENRRCINCNSLGPQYVCTTFLTFVCTSCSGLHREFTHRVKSISMAKFTADEVSALQAAGNERARQIYLKCWDPQRNSYPDGSNPYRIRDFIKHVYVDRKYAGEKSDKLPMLRLGEKEESYESSRKVGAYFGESRGVPYESRYLSSSSKRSVRHGRSDERNSRYYIDEISPGYNPESSRFSGYRKRSVHFEIVDDRFRDDVSGRRFDSRGSTNREHKSGSRSPVSQRNTNSSSSVVVCSIKDILGENAPSLEVRRHSKTTDGKDADDYANNQKTVPSGSQHSVDENPMEHKKAQSESLINLSNDSEPTGSAAAAVMQPQPQMQTQPITPLSDGGDQSSLEPPAKEKALVAPPPNSLELLLLELSGPFVVQNTDDAPSTVSGSEMPSSGELPSNVNTSTTVSTATMQVQPNGGNTPEAVATMQVQPNEGNMPEASVSPTAPLKQMLVLPSCVPVQPSGSKVPLNNVSPTSSLGQMTTSPKSFGDSSTMSTAIVPLSSFHGGSPQATPDISVESNVKVLAMQQLNSSQQQQPLASFAVDGRNSSVQQTTTRVGRLNDQPWPLSRPSNQGPSCASAEQSSQTVIKSDQNTSSSVVSEPLPVETKSNGRKELPAELFTASYPPVHAQVPHCNTRPADAMGFEYYPNAMLVPFYSNQAKSINPFDFGSETTPLQVPQFPSMASLQGAVPNTGLLSTSNFATSSPGLMAPQSPSYASGMHPQSPCFSQAMSSGAFMGQQIQTNMTLTRLQGIDGFGSDRTVFGNMSQQPTGRCPIPTATNSYSSAGGNPFG